jgi:hypothetical protein
MMGKMRARISSAHLIGVVALVFAVAGGTALALPGVNSVNSGDVVNNSLRGKDVRNNSLTGRDVRETTLNCGAIPSADCSADDVVEGGAGAPVPGAPGAPGAAAPTQAFNRLIAAGDSSEVSVGGFRLRANAIAGNTCGFATLIASEPSRWMSFNYTVGAPNQDALAAGGSIPLISDGQMGKVVARADDGSGVAVFEHTLDTNTSPSGTRCHFAGSAIGG